MGGNLFRLQSRIEKTLKQGFVMVRIWWTVDARGVRPGLLS